MEEHFKKTLSKAKIDWDKEQLWEELEPKLPTKKRRYGWVGFLLLLLSGSGLAVWVYPSVSDSSQYHALIEKGRPQVETVVDHVYPEEKTASKNQASELYLMESPGGAQKSTQVKAETLAHSQKGKDKKQDHKSTESITTLALSQKKSPKKEKSIYTPKLEQFPGIRDTIKVAKTEFWSFQANKTNEDALSLLKTVNITSVFPYLDALPFSTLTSRETIPDWKGVPEAKGQQHPGLFFDFAVGMGELSRTAAFAQADSILRSNKRWEKTSLSIAGDLGVGYQARSGIFVKSGLQYRSILEQLDWKTTFVSDSLIPEYEKAFFELVTASDTVFYPGPAEARFFETRKVFHNNRITILSVPLEVGIEKQIKRVKLGAHAGLKWAFFSDFKGRLINEERAVVDDVPIELENPIGYYFGLSAGYQMNQRYTVFLRSSYEQSPTILINRALQEYQSYQFQLGLKMLIRR